MVTLKRQHLLTSDNTESQRPWQAAAALLPAADPADELVDDAGDGTDAAEGVFCSGCGGCADVVNSPEKERR